MLLRKTLNEERAHPGVCRCPVGTCWGQANGANSAGERCKEHPPEVSTALSHQEGGGHYKSMAIQPVQYIHANGLPFCEGCVIKYVSRWRSKGGIADLLKARHFLDLLIELESKA